MTADALKLNAGRFFQEPLRGPALVGTALLVWLAGAAYCRGYERLLTGADEWAGSLIWSAVAVLPWFALFEWSKLPAGAQATRRPLALVGLVVAIAVASILLEYVVNWSVDTMSDHFGLLAMRRLPAIAAALMLIALARKTVLRRPADPSAIALENLAEAIEFVAAADNYVELHSNGRVTMRRTTMAEAEKALAKRGFIRIHRRYLVNRDQIVAITGNGDKQVRLANGSELPVGRRYASNLPTPA